MDEAARDEALAVVEALAPFEPSVADVVDALEAVLGGPDEIRRVLDEAERAGLIERDGRRVRVPSSRRGPTGRRGRVIERDGEFGCRRCGRSLSTGYFVRAGGTEVGPYGSTCVDKVLGRD